MQIAIDGPAGAGKSTIAKKIAQEMGVVYVDTGAMYRALTLKAMQKGIELNDAETLFELALSTNIHFENINFTQQIFCDNENVSEAIRSPQVSNVVSQVSSHPLVRQVMVKKQQEMAQTTDIVMDGRDIGECVLPNADYKFFVTASIEERTRRRIEELRKKGYDISLESIRDEIIARDKSDMQREIGALKILEDSIVIDTSNLSIAEVLDKILSIIRKE